MNMMTNTIDADAHQRARRSSRIRIGAIAIAFLIIAFGVWKLFHRPAAPPPPPAANVTVATPLVREVRAWDDYVGRFAPSRTVEIRPRVAGEVAGVHFQDGQFVRQGQLLFTIDPRPFAAALAEARANSASARSALALANADLARANRLKGDEAISAGEVDSLKARLQAAQAGLAAAQARERQKLLDVQFTAVRAPISGRISDRRVDAGNQVAGGEGTSGTVLTTINALNPIYFTFDGSEALFLKAQRARLAGARATPVEIQLQDESGYRWKGRLDFTDNGLDTHSGTIRGRAILANPQLFLTPGMFGNMRLASSGTAPAMLVPDSAVQTDQARKTVLVVGPDNVAVTKPVVIGPLVQGLRIVRSGLAATDRVIIAGTQSAMPGSKVAPTVGKIALVNVAPAPIAEPIAGQATIAGN